jgi:hypothetical protein
MRGCETLTNECLLETYYYDETCVVLMDDDCEWYACRAEMNGCDCDGARNCDDGWCKGTAGAGREGTHYPYDPAGSFAYDPANDEDYWDHYVDDISGYPTMIDPATGLVWGIDPDTGEPFDGIDWPMDDDDKPLDPTYETDLSIFGEHPLTPGFYFGQDPAREGRGWHSAILEDLDGTVLNPYIEPEDGNIVTPGDGTDVVTTPCEDPDNTYRPVGEEDCI